MAGGRIPQAHRCHFFPSSFDEALRCGHLGCVGQKGDRALEDGGPKPLSWNQTRAAGAVCGHLRCCVGTVCACLSKLETSGYIKDACNANGKLKKKFKIFSCPLRFHISALSL